MATKLKRSYRFALRASLLIVIFCAVIATSTMYYYAEFNWVLLALILTVIFVGSFAIIQIGIEKYIYRKIKQIYDDVSLLESSSLTSDPVTTDMQTLTAEIEKFAADKKIEIDTLKIREAYRKDFLGNVSHELKTPLFTVQGYIETLLDGALDDKNVRRKYLQRANKGVERLIYIVKDLDMITKLEVGDLNLEHEDFDIVELIQSVFDLLEMKAAKKKLALTFDMKYEEPVYVHTTEVSVENLIKNKVIVRVTDNGEGIDKQYVPRLFERFFRVDQSGNRKEGGSGLGLAIVKHIIEAHGEKIYVESVLGAGSEFSFTLEKAVKTEPIPA